MFSRVKNLALRLRKFLKRLPEVWALTRSTNDPYAAIFTPYASMPGGYENSSAERNLDLLNMDKLGIPMQHRAVFLAINKAVRSYMYGDQYDPSHDYEHIQRVVKYVRKIYIAEKNAGRLSPHLDVTTMYLAALMHDVGETKYFEKGRTQEEVVVEMMLECGASLEIANKVATIAVNVSFTRELKAVDRTLINAIIEVHPELAFVQDADRLDALGPSGQIRCSVYGGANEERRKQSIHTGVQLHHKRFQYYLGMMKTRTGRAIAEQKWSWMVNFRRDWHEDTDVSSVL
ncbi:hypothetical protein N0V90_012258 [Kalmusia sp. IMI 367209]|nr:hypothetical protein N0V90_012258 [Kalmusia sp. IMI 367209]